MSNIINHPCKAPIDRIRELEDLLDTAITGCAMMEKELKALGAENLALKRKLTCKRHAMRVFLGMSTDDLTPA